MKSILISDHAIWCALMMNGKKKIEVRKGTALYKATKKLIDEYGFAEFYVYCTKDKSLIYTDGTDGKGDYVDYQYYESYKGDKNDIGSGKVVFKFRCYKVEEIFVGEENNDYFYKTKHLKNEKLRNKSCLSNTELLDYLNLEEGIAIHISDLEIFDEPKELSEFKVRRNDCPFPCDICNVSYCQLKKAPQSWCYVEL